MQCQHHQLPVSDSQKIVTFWLLSVSSPCLLFWETYRLFCMYAGVKNALHNVVLKLIFTICPFSVPIPPPLLCFYCLSGSSFSTDYTFFAARFIISQQASIWKFPLQIIPLLILYFPPLCLLLVHAMFLVSVPLHSFLSAFSQLLSCFLPHRCFHMAVVPEVAHSAGECLCTDLSEY